MLIACSPRAHCVPAPTAMQVRVPEAEFLRYPMGAIRDAMEAAVPRLPELRRNLLMAREELLLGVGASPLEMTPMRGADLVLLQAGRAYCPRTPSTLKACIEPHVV